MVWEGPASAGEDDDEPRSSRPAPSGPPASSYPLPDVPEFQAPRAPMPPPQARPSRRWIIVVLSVLLALSLIVNVIFFIALYQLS